MSLPITYSAYQTHESPQTVRRVCIDPGSDIRIREKRKAEGGRGQGDN